MADTATPMSEPTVSIPTISYEQMRAGMYVRDKDIIEWGGVNNDLRWWIGGHMDADGCVRMCPVNGLMVRIGKAENGWHCLVWLKKLLQGAIYDSTPENETEQAMREWCLRGQAALNFCRVIKDYCFLKKPQLIKGCEFVFGELWMLQMKPVAATNRTTGEMRVFAGPHHAAREMCISNGNICNCIRGKNRTKSVGNCTWQYIENPVKEDEARARRKKLEIELSAMKHVEHLPIDIELSKPYIAGFVDGDGHLGASGSSAQCHAVSQKYIAICDALKREYGGCIWRNSTTGVYKWTLCRNAKDFLIGIAPYLIEKRKQAELILGMKAGEGKAVKAALSLLKGRQLPKKRAQEITLAQVTTRG